MSYESSRRDGELEKKRAMEEGGVQDSRSEKWRNGFRVNVKLGGKKKKRIGGVLRRQNVIKRFRERLVLR